MCIRDSGRFVRDRFESARAQTLFQLRAVAANLAVEFVHGTVDGHIHIVGNFLGAQDYAADADGNLDDIAVAALLGKADLGLDVVLEVAFELGELFLHARLDVYKRQN